MAKTATATIPIVFSVSEDPVKLGLVASLARPGGNATGINFFTQEVTAKRLGLLYELVPKAVRFAALMQSGKYPDRRGRVTRHTRSRTRHRTAIDQVLKASTSREIEATFATLVRARRRRPLRRRRHILR